MDVTFSKILFFASIASIVLALGLSGGSLARSVKWNIYDSGTNWGVKDGPVSKLYAYQTLWTSYDASGGQYGDYAIAYTPVAHGKFLL